MRVVVHGANGFLGRHLVLHLLDAGHEVQGLVRRERAAELLRKLGCIASLYGPGEALPELLSDAVHVVLVYSEDAWEVRLLRLLLAHRKRVKGIVYASGLGVDDPRLMAHPHFQNKARAEEVIKGSGLPYAILRPSTVIGPGDEITPLFHLMARRGRLIVPPERYVFQPISIGDACRALAKASEALVDEGKRITLPLVGPQVMSYAAFAEELVEVLSRNGWLPALPEIRQEEVGSVALEWELTPFQADYTFSNATASSEELERFLGKRLEPIRACLERMFQRAF